LATSRTPSDCLIHWSSIPNGRDKKEFDKQVRQLRADWDLLCQTNSGKAALVRLLQAQHDHTSHDQAEYEAGASL
jgi:hypothetical protein